MRVITGSARGRKLQSPSGYDTRPTTDKMKETVFNVVQFELEGARMLDLFAGSGQMGIEALSRGASFCTFVEKNTAAIKLITENIKVCGFQEESEIVKMDVLSFLQMGSKQYDLIFADPPYQFNQAKQVFENVSTLLSPKGLFLYEADRSEEFPNIVGDLHLEKTYTTGKTQVIRYRKGEVS